MSQRKAPHPRDNVGRSETPPIPLICSICRTCNGVRCLCPFCIGFPPVAVCQQCKEAPSYFRHIWECREGIPNAMPRAELPLDGPSSSPNVSSTAIDMSTQAPSSDIGTTLSSQVEEGFAAQPNVGTTTMRTSASECRGVIDLCSTDSSEESSDDDGGGEGHDVDDKDCEMCNVGDEEDDNEVDEPGAFKEGGGKKDGHEGEGVDEDDYEGGDEGDDKDNDDNNDDVDDKDGNNGVSDCNRQQLTEIVNLREVRVGQETNSQDGSITSRFSQDPLA